jgi:hypothetical protein
VGEQELDGADITVVGAPLKKRYATLVCRCRRVTRRDVIENQVCPPVCNFIEHVFAPVAMYEERFSA